MAQLGKPLKGAGTAKDGGGGGGAKDAGRGTGDAAERARLEALARMDLSRRLAAATRKQLKDKLEREREVSRINKSKVEAAWLKILRLAKIDGLRRDAEVLAQSHERESDRRDALLQLLDGDLDAAEEQFQQAVRDHLRSLDKLVDVQDGRLTDLERSFRAELAATEEQFAQEREELEGGHGEEVALVRATLATVREREETKADRARAARDQRREEVRNDTSDRMEELSRTMNDRILELEKAFEAAHVSYLERTDTMAERFKQMTAKDQTDLRAIRDFVGKEQRLQAQLTATRAKLVSAARDFGERNTSLSREREAMAGHVTELKRRIARSHGRWQARLSSLSGAATGSKASLAEQTGLAERVLRLNERCRELETEEEKVAPFFVASDDDPLTGAPPAAVAAGLVPARDGPGMEDGGAVSAAARAGVAGRGAEATGAGAGRDARTTGRGPSRPATTEAGPGAAGGGEEEEEGAGREGSAGFASLVTPSWPQSAADVVGSGQVESMELFFRRHNKVLAERVALEAEKGRLREENASLARMVKAALEGISLPEGMLDGANPLLVVNGKSGVTASAGGAPATTVIDATAATRTTRRAVGTRRG